MTEQPTPIDLATEQGTVKPAQDYAPGFYEQGNRLRYHDGTNWTEQYAPLRRDSATAGDVLWGLSLACGLAGGVPAAVGMPVLAFYFPLGFGAAAIGLAIAAGTSPRKGSAPWWAAVAVLAGIVAILAGMDGYDQFSAADDALNSLGD